MIGKVFSFLSIKYPKADKIKVERNNE